MSRAGRGRLSEVERGLVRLKRLEGVEEVEEI
jgi:hypothetical protein